MRSRSRWNAGRIGSSGSGRSRPRVSALFAACGASISRSRASSCSADASSPAKLTDARSSCRAAAAPRRTPRRASAPRSANVARVAEIDTGRAAAPVTQQRHVLARVIGARRRRIVAVIGGDDQQVVRAQRRQQIGQPGVEALEVARVAGDVVAMTVQRVEVHEVGEDQAASTVAIAASTASMPSSSLAVETRRVMPRPANRSSILPIAYDRDARRRSADRAASRRTAAPRSRADWPCA